MVVTLDLEGPEPAVAACRARFSLSMSIGARATAESEAGTAWLEPRASATLLVS